jgi:hypothetical protein
MEKNMIDSNVAAIQPFGRLNKSVLVQLATDHYLELLDITRRHHRECARKHGLDYWCVEGAPVRDKRAAWGKAPLVLAATALGYESVVWLDADAVIVRPEVDLANLACHGVAMVRHPNPEHWETKFHWNSGFFVSRANVATQRLWRLVDESPENDSPWMEQFAINNLAETAEFGPLFQPLDLQFNCVPDVVPADNPVIVAGHGLPFLRRREILIDALARFGR